VSASQLFVIDPITRLNPAKDSSVALMQAVQRAGQAVWVCTPADLSALAPPASEGSSGHSTWALAQPVQLGAIALESGAWQVPSPWFELGEVQSLPLEHFQVVWMRKDPPVDEAYLYATHLLDIAERRGVRVVNRPSSLRAWNEKLSSLRFSHLMAPSMVSSRVEQLADFARDHGDVVEQLAAGWGHQHATNEGQSLVVQRAGSLGGEVVAQLQSSVHPITAGRGGRDGNEVVDEGRPLQQQLDLLGERHGVTSRKFCGCSPCLWIGSQR
jgi:glutathione synthase